MISVQERLESKLMPITESGCSIFTGSTDKYNGYGQLSVNGKKVKTHRLMWEFFKGAIPYNLEVMHKCDVKSCCNINHLELGTHKQNMLDASLRGKSKSGWQKLSNNDVSFIRNSKEKLKSLANLFNVSEATISRAKNGVHFKFQTLNGLVKR